MDEIVKYSGCFVCGDSNPGGLKARFFYDGVGASTELTADERFEGYKGIFHGGIISALLDEVMIKAILAENVYAVTAELTVRFRAPIRTGDPIVAAGRVTSRKGRMYLTEGTMTAAGKVVATAEAKYIEARPEMRRLLLESIDSN